MAGRSTVGQDMEEYIIEREMKEHGVVLYLNIIRIIAAALVVLVHVAASAWNDVAPQSASWQFLNAMSCLGIVGVGLFFMISGAIMLDESRSLTIGKLLLKTLRLYGVYLFFLLLYNVAEYWVAGTPLTLQALWSNLFVRVLQGKGAYHLWFLPALIGLYLVTPLFRKICESRTVSRYFLLLWVLIIILPNTVFAYEVPYKYTLLDHMGQFTFPGVAGYAGYYVLGHYLRNHSWNSVSKLGSRARMMIIGMIGMAGYMAAVIASSVDAYTLGVASVRLNNPLMLPTLLATTAAFMLIKEAGTIMPASSPFINGLAKLTMGIYLLHPLALTMLHEMGYSVLDLPLLLSIPLTVLAVMVLTGLVTYLWRGLQRFTAYVRHSHTSR